VYAKHQSQDVENGKLADSNNGTVAVDDDIAATTTRRRRSLKAKPVRVLLRRLLVMSLVAAVLVGLGAVVWYFLGWVSLVQLVLVAVVAYIAAGNYRWFYVVFKTAPRDLRALFKYIRLLIEVKSFQRKDVTLADIFRQNVKRHPNKPCILFEDQAWTFAQVEEYSNRIANLFKSHGYKKGDRVALFLENKPEFVCTWLGLSKLGVITPLINTNQRLSSLVHSLTIAKAQAVIFGIELADAVTEVLDKIESKVALYQLSCSSNVGLTDQKFHNLDVLLKDVPDTPPQITDKLGHHDCIVYIYTSGTTGLPKAAVINTSRYIFIAGAIHWMCGFTSKDIFYTPLPLYHTAGGCMTVGQMLIYGSTIVIRKKFSASGYFADCRKYKCTIAQYIGEMCRYILAVPPKDSDTDHNLRMIFGNGLRPQIWKEFVDRFNIPKVGEFYGATEGNANIVNVDNTVGSIGFMSRIIPAVYPISVIKVDPHTGEPVRDARGLCMPCAPNEPGVFIGKIIPNNPSRAFLGYVDKEASEKKIVHDVFQHGDSAFLSGDILVADEFGNLFFKDRTGDTFRWKGENVSTSEVEAVISNLVDYKDVVVYGVVVRGQEGRAGMAAVLDPDETVDLNKLVEGVKKTLPSYARPIFIRILRKIDLTGTYKLKKNDLQSEGFDPSKISDNIYYLESSTGVYGKLTPEIYDKINDGSVRV
ncbi:hypothetical protein NQ315_015832, partial [Exocentrus adspersus]